MFQEHRLFTILVVLALLSSRPIAQSTASSLRPPQQQGVVVLKGLYEKSKEFSDDRLRIETQTEIARLLWRYDEPSARRYFTDAYKAIDQMEDEEHSIPIFNSPKMTLRGEVLWAAMSQDSALGEALIQAMPKIEVEKRAEAKRERRKLYLWVARFLIAKEPKRAAKIIQNNLDGTITMEFASTLRTFREKEPLVADDLLRQWLLKRQVNAENPTGDFLILSIYFRPSEEKPDNKGSNDTAQELAPTLIEPLLDFAFHVMTLHGEQEQKQSANPQRKRFLMGDMINVGIIASLLPLFEKHRPEQAGIIRAHLGQAANTLPSEIRNGAPPPRPKTIEELISEAQKEKDDFLRDFHYREAAELAGKAGDYDRALEIAGRIPNPDRRPNISLIREMGAHDAIKKGNVSEAYRAAKDLPEVDERAALFSQIALKAFEKSDLQRANELLSVAEKLVEKTATSPKQASALLQIASTKAAINWGRAFESAKAAIEAINALYANPSTKPRFDYFHNTNSFRENLGVLARHDFQRALSLAQAIEKTEISVQAQLSVCAGVLAENATAR